ncbi:MAG: hypothetical protein ACE5KM_19655, partial [Planctomycetaceae bacterium]
ALRNADDTATDTKVAAITADDLGRARRGAKVSGTDGGFGEFLRNRQDGQKQPKGGDGHEKSDDNDNQPPKWKLTIFTGSERRVVEVEDPSAVIPEKKKRADEKDSQPTPKTGAETGA